MATERNSSTEEIPLVGHRLVSWPLALIALTLALLFVANSVSAWGRRGANDLEGIRSHAERFIDRALDRLDATDEQSTLIQAIVSDAIDDLHAARGDADSVREEIRTLLLADSLDRDALEHFRQTHLQRADEMSRIVTTRLADIMDVLTTEQRQELESHIDKHHGRHGCHGWGWH